MKAQGVNKWNDTKWFSTLSMVPSWFGGAFGAFSGGLFFNQKSISALWRSSGNSNGRDGSLETVAFTAYRGP